MIHDHYRDWLSLAGNLTRMPAARRPESDLKPRIRGSPSRQFGGAGRGGPEPGGAASSLAVRVKVILRVCHESLSECRRDGHRHRRARPALAPRPGRGRLKTVGSRAGGPTSKLIQNVNLGSSSENRSGLIRV